LKPVSPIFFFQQRIEAMRCLSSLLVLSLGMLGCTSAGEAPPKLYPVTGKVVIGGKPLDKINVQLMPVDLGSTARPGSGTTDAEGKFTILTNGDKGAAAGKYKVVLMVSTRPQGQQMSVEEASKMSGEMSPRMAQVSGGADPASLMPATPFPPEWGDASKSPKEVEVTNQPVVINIDI
jgi:hypothetical protein